MQCMYCEKGEKLNSAGIRVCELKVCELYLNREQSYPGRLILVLKNHKEELFELNAREHADLMDDICVAGRAMTELYNPDRINYGMYGDSVKHIHVHIVPKKREGLDWNSVFQMNPRKTYLEEQDYETIAQSYRRKIEELS